MAVSAVNKTYGNDAVDRTAYTTASITPSANKLLLASFSSRTGISTDPTQPTCSGCGLTWVLVATIVYDTTSSSRRRVSVFRAMGASPTTGALTFDEAGQTQTAASWSVDEFTNTDTSGTNGSGAIVQSVTKKDETGTVNSLSITLAAFENSNNATFGAFAEGATWGFSVGTGFTILGAETGDAEASQECNTEFKSTTDTTVDCSWPSMTGTPVGGIAIEIRSNDTRIALDTSTNVGNTSGTSLTFAHTCTGTNLLLFVLVLASSDVITGVTYNGVAMTQVGKQAGSPGEIYLYALAGPATGANNVVISASGTTTILGMAASYTGAQQSTTMDATNGVTANNIADGAWTGINLTTVADNCWYIMGSAITASKTPASASQCTTRQAVASLGLFDSNAGKTPAGAVAPQAKCVGGGTQSWCHFGCSFTVYTAPTTSIKKVSGVAYASIKKVSGVAIASVKKVAGLA